MFVVSIAVSLQSALASLQPITEHMMNTASFYNHRTICTSIYHQKPTVYLHADLPVTI